MLTITLFVATLIGQVVGQLDAGVPGVSAGNSIFNGSRLCNRTFADANAVCIPTFVPCPHQMHPSDHSDQTGIRSFNPEVAQGPQTLQPDRTGFLTDPVSWAATVYQSEGTDNFTELSLWFSPHGANYSDNFGLGYDACYLWLNAPSINTVARGQTDNGSCLTMFDAACVGDLQSLTDQYASELVGVPSPGPNSNLSTNSLPIVCSDIAQMLTQNFPKSCDIFFNTTKTAFGGLPALGGPLTGNQSLVERSHCAVNQTYSLMWSQYGSATAFNYELANWYAIPLITVFMPIADAARTITLASSKSFMTCLRADTVNPDSRSVPPAPQPTPLQTPTDTAAATSSSSSSAANVSNNMAALSGGTIAGIVIGILLGLLLIGLAIFFVRRRQKRSNDKPHPAELSAVTQPAVYSELEHKSHGAQMHGAPVAEMDHKEPARELPAYSETAYMPVELDGNSQLPWSKR